MTRGKWLFQISAGAVILAFLAMFLWAGRSENVLTALERMLGDPWGITTLFDLGIGLAFAGMAIYLIEGSLIRALPWLILLILLGNLATAAYLLRRSLRAGSVRGIFSIQSVQPREY
ncbi:MAG: hypothetical protein KF841_08285 [Phycisphaerae bacterium]|nr:hypothetical protein [Phycisphaerae bacterium]